MKIERNILGAMIQIELTEQELVEAHKDYIAAEYKKFNGFKEPDVVIDTRSMPLASESFVRSEPTNVGAKGRDAVFSSGRPWLNVKWDSIEERKSLGAELRRKGYTWPEISRMLGVSKTQVYFDQRTSCVTVPRCVSESQRQEIVAAYQDGYGILAIAKKTGFGCDTIRRTLAASGVKMRSQAEGVLIGMQRYHQDIIAC